MSDAGKHNNYTLFRRKLDSNSIRIRLESNSNLIRNPFKLRFTLNPKIQLKLNFIHEKMTKLNPDSNWIDTRRRFFSLHTLKAITTKYELREEMIRCTKKFFAL